MPWRAPGVMCLQARGAPGCATAEDHSCSGVCSWSMWVHRRWSSRAPRAVCAGRQRRPARLRYCWFREAMVLLRGGAGALEGGGV